MSSAKIKKYLKESNLSLAITELRKQVEELGNYDLITTLEEVQNTYTAMLTYMLQGYMDKDCSARRDDIKRALFSIVDQADRLNYIIKENNKAKYLVAHKSVQTTTFENIIQRLEVNLCDSDHDEEICKLFDWTWTSNVWKKNDYNEAISLLNSDKIAVFDKAVFISAVTFGLLETFDVRKLHLLFDAYLNEEGDINQRAIVGIALAIRWYDSRLTCYPEITSRLEMYADNAHFINEIFSTITMLQYTTITDKVTSKMANDIIPTILNHHKPNTSTSAQDFQSEMTRNGENPEWLENSKVKKSLKAMTELVHDGADVYMSTFRYMKGYPFFNKIPHWLYPFDINCPVFTNNDDITDSIISNARLMASNDVFCNSDMYSLVYMLASLSKLNANAVTEDICNHIGGEEEYSLLIEEAKKKKKDNKAIRRAYIFDLYRLYVCNNYGNQFNNPFKIKTTDSEGKETYMSFSPLNTKCFSFLKENREQMIDLAEFFMRKEFYKEALAMYDIIQPKEIEDEAYLWQKVGFCKQKLGKDKSAYKTYLMADTLLPDSKWTMSHIAQLAQKLEIYDTALSYYDLLLQQDDENEKFILNKATCQMKLEMYEDAINTLYKASYLDENSIEIREMMIENYLLNGQVDKAFELLQNIITNPDCSTDMRILYALLLLKEHSTQYASNALRESIIIYKEKEDVSSFVNHYDNFLKKYIHLLSIDESVARMLFDLIILDIL